MKTAPAIGILVLGGLLTAVAVVQAIEHAQPTTMEQVSGITPKLVPQLRPPNVYDVVHLPATDVRGKTIPKGPKLVVSLPACNSCSKSPLNMRLLPKSPRSPVVAVVEDASSNLDPNLVANQSILLVNKSLCKLPDALTYYANTIVAVDEQGKITGYAPPQTAEQFLKEWK